LHDAPSWGKRQGRFRPAEPASTHASTTLHAMKSARFALPSTMAPRAACVASIAALLSLAALCGPAQAGVQWKWKDAKGAIQYSDRPPPPGTPESAILSKPAAYKAPVSRAVSDAASAASAPTPAASATVDPTLEARRKKADDEKQAKKKADDEKVAAQKADNCQRARGYQRSLQDGLRITRTSPSGEREVLDDKARAEEVQRTQEAITANCN
jgi:hypothetical protein